MKLAFEKPETTEKFVAWLRKLDVVLPVAMSESDVGTLVDAGGHPVLQVDPLGTRHDDATTAIAAAIMVAINTCGGFKVVAP